MGCGSSVRRGPRRLRDPPGLAKRPGPVAWASVGSADPSRGHGSGFAPTALPGTEPTGFTAGGNSLRVSTLPVAEPTGCWVSPRTVRDPGCGDASSTMAWGTSLCLGASSLPGAEPTGCWASPRAVRELGCGDSSTTMAWGTSLCPCAGPGAEPTGPDTEDEARNATDAAEPIAPDVWPVPEARNATDEAEPIAPDVWPAERLRSAPVGAAPVPTRTWSRLCNHSL